MIFRGCYLFERLFSERYIAIISVFNFEDNAFVVLNIFLEMFMFSFIYYYKRTKRKTVF